ncbi:MAG TPA: helix-turn-helix transcriptional regulator [Calditerricola sp.]
MYRRGWTKTELHRRAKVSRMTIDGLIAGRKPLPETVNKIADALDIPRDEAHRLAGLIKNDDSGEPEGKESDPDAEVRRLLERLPERRRRALERILRDARERYESLIRQARVDYERTLQGVSDVARSELTEE